MRILILRFIAAVVMTISIAAQGYDFKRVAEQHILPSYQQLYQSTNFLADRADAYCREYEPQQLMLLEMGYVNAFTAWQSVQHLRFGPIQNLSRYQRFQVWPDSENSVVKHLVALMTDFERWDNVEGAVDVSQEDVAIQGFSALEYLLYSGKTIDGKICRVISAIANNLKTMSENLVIDWQGGEEPYIEFFYNPGLENKFYDDEKAIANEIFESIGYQLKFIVSRKLVVPLGDELDKSRGRLAEGWRSNTGLTALKANVSAIKSLYLVAFREELKVTDKDIINMIKEDFVVIESLLSKISLPIKDSVADKNQRKNLLVLHEALLRLNNVWFGRMAKVLSLGSG